MRQRGIVNVIGLLLLPAVLPGCHLLMRLGEEPPERKSVERQPAERPPIPAPRSSGSETPSPPLPGLSPEIPKPPSPGLSPEASNQSENSSVRASATSRAAHHRRVIGNTGINTDTAITPGEGQYVYRTQLRFLQSHSSPGPADIDLNLLVNPHVLAYGVRENFTVFGVVPVVLREGTVRPPAGGISDFDDQGVADMRFFAKYRFYEQDQPGETTRWSVFSGLEVPTYDKDFSSDSFDPFIGTVWTYQSLEWGLDLDWFWNFNTGKGVFRHDEMRYDFAYTYVLLTGQTLDEKFWQLNSIFELNGSYVTDGSHLLFAAPGFQLALERMIVEASLQIPVIRDLKNTVEPDFVFVIGTRITW